jgi:hypothetical protein
MVFCISMELPTQVLNFQCNYTVRESLAWLPVKPRTIELDTTHYTVIEMLAED